MRYKKGDVYRDNRHPGDWYFLVNKDDDGEQGTLDFTWLNRDNNNRYKTGTIAVSDIYIGNVYKSPMLKQLLKLIL